MCMNCVKNVEINEDNYIIDKSGGFIFDGFLNEPEENGIKKNKIKIPDGFDVEEFKKNLPQIQEQERLEKEQQILKALNSITIDDNKDVVVNLRGKDIKIKDIKFRKPNTKDDLNSCPFDLIGKIQGHIKILALCEEKEKGNKGRPLYLCYCACGTFFIRNRDRILHNKDNSSCCSKDCVLKKTRRVDLRGKTFGKLTVIKNNGTKGKRKRVNWLCVCSCGNSYFINVDTDDLVSGNTKSCGCQKLENAQKRKGKTTVKINSIINKWKVIEIMPNQQIKCVCTCGCNEEKIMGSRQRAQKYCKARREIEYKKLKEIEKTMKTVSVPKNHKDLTGMKFGRLTVLGFCGKFLGYRYWLCQCSCEKKTIKAIKEDSLTRGLVVGCGCVQKEKSQRFALDLVGKRFGRLFVEKRVPSKPGRRATYFHCKCDCGNELDVCGSDLHNGYVSSCGCLKSPGEFNIAKFLNEHNIKYERQKSFPDCRDKNVLRFDFLIYYPNSEKWFLCEYQGPQHYGPVKFRAKWTQEEAEENYQNNLRRDNIKKEYCKNNNIELFEICYKDFKKIDEILAEKLGIEIKNT